MTFPVGWYNSHLETFESAVGSWLRNAYMPDDPSTNDPNLPNVTLLRSASVNPSFARTESSVLAGVGEGTIVGEYTSCMPPDCDGIVAFTMALTRTQVDLGSTISKVMLVTGRGPEMPETVKELEEAGAHLMEALWTFVSLVSVGSVKLTVESGMLTNQPRD